MNSVAPSHPLAQNHSGPPFSRPPVDDFRRLYTSARSVLDQASLGIALACPSLFILLRTTSRLHRVFAIFLPHTRPTATETERCCSLCSMRRLRKIRLAFSPSDSFMAHSEPVAANSFRGCAASHSARNLSDYSCRRESSATEFHKWTCLYASLALPAPI